MFARLTSWFRTGEREPLLSTREPVMNNKLKSQAPFTGQPTFTDQPIEIISAIASYLDDYKDWASLARVCKQMHVAIEGSKTNLDVLDEDENGKEMIRKATYAELREIFNGRMSKEQMIIKIEPNKFSKEISEARQDVPATCGCFLWCVAAVGTAAIPMLAGIILLDQVHSTIGNIGGFALEAGGGATLVCCIRLHTLFSRNVVKKEKEVAALRKELDATPKISVPRNFSIV